MIHERAPAKVNFVLQIGPLAANGLHEVCSLFASLDLADDVEVREADADRVICEGVDGPNLAEAAIHAFREALRSESTTLKGSDPLSGEDSDFPPSHRLKGSDPLSGGDLDFPPSHGRKGSDPLSGRDLDLPPLEVRIHKRIPVAAGLAGGSADAAAVLRAANRIAGGPFDADRLRRIAAPLGSDVPSQVEPAAAVVTGTGERVERVRLPEMWLVLVPAQPGLSTADVFREAERLGIPRDATDPAPLHQLAGAPVERIAEGMDNDLQAAALSLRPRLGGTLEALREHGALAAMVSGSGPTCFGVFRDARDAELAAAALPGSVLTKVAGQ